MKKSRILAMLLTAVMAVSIVPFSAFAAPTEPTPPAPLTNEEGELVLHKDAVLNDDGSYTITMEAYATGATATQTVETGVPLDIVMVIDQSGSLKDGDKKVNNLDPLKTAVGQFVESVYQDGAVHKVDHRIGIVGFASNEVDGTSDTKSDPNHPVAGGSTTTWVNTGIFDANGDFKNYKAESGTENYVLFDGELNTNLADTYYVKLSNGKYAVLTYNRSVTADQYPVVENPATDRTDLYGKVNGTYKKAQYGEYGEKIEAKNPTQGSEAYFDEKGNVLTWKPIKEPDRVEYQPIKGTIQSGNAYYVKFWDGTFHKIWEHGKNNYWRDDTQGNRSVAYDIDSKDHKGFTWLSTRYDAYEKVTVPGTTKTVLTTPDGKEYTGKVYTHNMQTGWYVGTSNDATPVSVLYEKVSGKGAWEYEDNGENKNLTNEDVFVIMVAGDLTAADYKGALVPVSDGPDGTGAKRASLQKAVNSFGASGATRMATGIEMGNEIFVNNPLTEADKAAGRKRVMIVFTDGEPGFSGYEEGEANKALEEIAQTKSELGATVYTIGLYSDVNEQRDTFMSQLSSNYPGVKSTYKKITGSKDEGKVYYVQPKKNGKYYPVKFYEEKTIGGQTLDGWYYQDDNGKYVKPSRGTTYYEIVLDFGTETSTKYYQKVADVTKLQEIFKTITHDSTNSTTSITLDEKAILRDIMGDNFQLSNQSKVNVKIVEGKGREGNNGEKIFDWGKEHDVLTLVHNVKPAPGTLTPAEEDTKTVTVNKGVTNPDLDGAAHSSEQTLNIHAAIYTETPEGKPRDTVDITGFDYAGQYISKSHAGSKLVVTVTYVVVEPGVPAYQIIHTNHEMSGLWRPSEGPEYPAKPEGLFPRPSTFFISKTYVQDYARPMSVPLEDLKLTSVKNIDPRGYYAFDIMNPTKEITHTFGNVDGKNNQIVYTPTTMKWDGSDSFYAFGKTNLPEALAESANKNGNLWTEIKVIPANNVYYEDTFITDTTNTTGTVGIEYGGFWEEEKGTAPDTNTTDPEAPQTLPDDVQGWVPALKDETGDTDGSSHHANAGNGNRATAKFTFTGTGVDVYSRTSKTSGTVLAKLIDHTGKMLEGKVVDTKSISSNDGFYYQIPTLSFAGYKHGTYTVELEVTTFAKDRFDFYLDGIRVYNPILEDQTTQDAYGPDEQNAAFIEVRDKLLDSESFSAEDNGVSTGFVFIDQLNNGTGGVPGTEGNTDQVLGVGTYEDLGPKNEVYLKPMQSISFKPYYLPTNKFYVGLKSPTGQEVRASITGANGIATPVDINHTADMYYPIAPTESGVITITNMSMGNELLSITKLKLTNPTAPVDTATVFEETTVPELLMATRSFYEAPVDPAPVEPEPVDPAPVEPEPVDPVPSEPGVDITNPEPPAEPEKPAKPAIYDILDKIFSSIFKWF